MLIWLLTLIYVHAEIKRFPELKNPLRPAARARRRENPLDAYKRFSNLTHRQRRLQEEVNVTQINNTYPKDPRHGNLIRCTLQLVNKNGLATEAPSERILDPGHEIDERCCKLRKMAIAKGLKDKSDLKPTVCLFDASEGLGGCDQDNFPLDFVQAEHEICNPKVRLGDWERNEDAWCLQEFEENVAAAGPNISLPESLCEQSKEPKYWNKTESCGTQAEYDELEYCDVEILDAKISGIAFKTKDQSCCKAMYVLAAAYLASSGHYNALTGCADNNTAAAQDYPCEPNSFIPTQGAVEKARQYVFDEDRECARTALIGLSRSSSDSTVASGVARTPPFGNRLFRATLLDGDMDCEVDHSATPRENCVAWPGSLHYGKLTPTCCRAAKTLLVDGTISSGNGQSVKVCEVDDLFGGCLSDQASLNHAFIDKLPSDAAKRNALTVLSAFSMYGSDLRHLSCGNQVLDNLYDSDDILRDTQGWSMRDYWDENHDNVVDEFFKACEEQAEKSGLWLEGNLADSISVFCAEGTFFEGTTKNMKRARCIPFQGLYLIDEDLSFEGDRTLLYDNRGGPIRCVPRCASHVPVYPGVSVFCPSKDVCNPQCSEHGSILSPNLPYVCRHSQWVGLAKCKPRECDRVEIKNGEIGTCNGTRCHEGYHKVRCDSGYHLGVDSPTHAPQYAHCQQGHWNVLPMCVSTRAPPLSSHFSLHVSLMVDLHIRGLTPYDFNADVWPSILKLLRDLIPKEAWQFFDIEDVTMLDSGGQVLYIPFNVHLGSEGGLAHGIKDLLREFIEPNIMPIIHDVLHCALAPFKKDFFVHRIAFGDISVTHTAREREFRIADEVLSAVSSVTNSLGVQLPTCVDNRPRDTWGENSGEMRTATSATSSIEHFEEVTDWGTTQFKRWQVYVVYGEWCFGRFRTFPRSLWHTKGEWGLWCDKWFGGFPQTWWQDFEKRGRECFQSLGEHPHEWSGQGSYGVRCYEQFGKEDVWYHSSQVMQEQLEHGGMSPKLRGRREL